MPEEKPRRENEEKEEKNEKQEEKGDQGWDEKWRRDPLTAAAWACILIWAGVVLLAHNLGMLSWIPFLESWSIFFLGAAAILFIEVGLRLLLPAYRQPIAGTVILAFVFLAIGLGSVINWNCIWPLILIGIGVYALFTGLIRRRE